MKKIKEGSTRSIKHTQLNIKSDTSIDFNDVPKGMKFDEKSMRGIPISMNQLEEEGIKEQDMFVYSKMKKMKSFFDVCKFYFKFNWKAFVKSSRRSSTIL